MSNEEILTEIITLFRQSVQDRAAQVTTLHKLIEESEQRITHVNEMVNNLVGTINGISQKYEQHIDRMADTRDKAIEQNSRLVELVADMRNDIERERKRWDNLLDAYKELALHKGHPGTAINVK